MILQMKRKLKLMNITGKNAKTKSESELVGVSEVDAGEAVVEFIYLKERKYKIPAGGVRAPEAGREKRGRY